MDVTFHQSKTKKAVRKKRQTIKTVNRDDPSKISKRNKANNQCLASSSLPSASIFDLENNMLNDYLANNFAYYEEDKSTPLTNRFKSSVNIFSSEEKDKTKTVTEIEDKDLQTPETVNSDDSENSSEGKGTARKDRKPLPFIFNQSRLNSSNNGSSSEASEDTCKDTSSCVYLGEKETLKSFWDKCLYECFKSKRCVAGEKPKRKYRKKPKIQKPPLKKRKQLEVPLSCIDTKGTAVTRTDYLNRYEMLLYMDPLADCVTPMQKKDFEMAFRMIKPSDLFALNSDNNNESTDYTNSDTDQEDYDN